MLIQFHEGNCILFILLMWVCYTTQSLGDDDENVIVLGIDIHDKDDVGSFIEDHISESRDNVSKDTSPPAISLNTREKVYGEIEVHRAEGMNFCEYPWPQNCLEDLQITFRNATAQEKWGNTDKISQRNKMIPRLLCEFPTCKLYFFLHASGDNGCKIDNDLFQYSCHYFHPTVLCNLVNSKCIASKLAQVWLHNNSSYFHMHHQKL
jgi:hypothetical protein